MSDYLEANRANWDNRARIHAKSRFYDLDGWAANPKPLASWETKYIGDITGLDALHLQCHIGTDTLAMLVSGAATVTGVDLSPASLAVARDLAARSGLADRSLFVESDVFAASAALGGKQFDLVYVSLGALCWLPSVTRWAEQVGLCLKPGGRFYIHDGHPLQSAFAWEDGVFTRTISESYYEETDPWVYDSDVTYTDGEEVLTATTSYEWNHSMGEIVNALIAAGLRIDSLDEHDWTVFNSFPDMVPSPDNDGRYFMPAGTPRFPQSFTITATKTG